ncbi:MAG TPA: 50S ribosomal protein L23 [Candidatus Magasanikbacteria bacterium]|nr:50S ribosomal protein L23 [Candidatus Magasanikbacteria bacterium]
MGILNRWATKKENEQANEKRAASAIKKVKETTKTTTKEAAAETKTEKKVVKPVEEKKKEVKTAATEKEVTAKTAYKVLIRPLITEKSTYLQSEGTYVFEVFPSTTKTEIKKAVQALYKVKVTGIRIVNLQGKQVRFGRVQGRRKASKKAMVTLQKGQVIELHKNV